MYVLFQVLEQTEHLPRILENLANIGVPGVTVLDSVGMGRILYNFFLVMSHSYRGN